jgi:hypothetical protein
LGPAAAHAARKFNSGSDDELTDEATGQDEPVKQVDHDAGEVAVPVVDDQPGVGADGFGTDRSSVCS